jgi:pimeloyl-ACP methyl ester carboxylesterase
LHAYPPLRRELTCVGDILAMPYVVSGDVKLYFENDGRGYPIIFLHELESDLRMWDSQIRHFARDHRCIAYNARGYPPSDVPDEAALYGWEQSVEDVAAIMHSLSVHRAHLVGSSMGGYAALQFALRYPEKTGAIVAAGTGFGSSPLERQIWLKKMTALARAIAARGMKAMAQRMAHHPTRIQLKYKDPKSWREFLSRPQGARLIGVYDSQVAFGQSRVLLVWTRLIMPNGRSIVLERQPGADTAGYAGLEDGVDNHWGALFKAALLSTLFGVGSELGAGSDAGNNGDIIRALRRGSSDSLNQTGQRIVQRNLNIQPTVTIRPGFPVRVVVNRDLVLEPYKGEGDQHGEAQTRRHHG